MANLTLDSFSGQPAWFRESPNPPLSANDAMTNADQFLRTTEFPAASIDSVELSPFAPDAGHWYWRVRFRSFRAGGFNPSIDLAVLMDGTVVTPTITDRLDIGWPLPGGDVDAKSSDLTDQQIATTFVSELNPSRTFAGQYVEVVGQLTQIPYGHVHQATGRRLHLTLDNGTILIVESSGGWPTRFETDLDVTGQLIGIRQCGEQDPSWDNVTLYPAIRVDGIGVH